ncbi:N-acetyltransferase [Asanoa ishikariensis]|uniref:N-acetylglutamate synthase, GNAT family n=1 Tax=Asanoa ishikariensis TaxID=137265 RepID=A0A1H3QP15_9ACTN|nr:GNAT family N-acetyltransferase [Asanoa ishikariensis]GIF64886.1 N-acetyltransferase [Asanoa ishikariensis]SDZ14449.1 N-acetylglutamate synthase, GNAT family [Asanoa ishikariensis]
MLTVRRAGTDDDFGLVRQVRMAVIPYERAPSVAEMRASLTRDSLVLLVEDDGKLVGSGSADHSSITGAAVVTPRVLPEFRRQGVGTRVLSHLWAHAVTLGVGHVLAHTDDVGSRAFAERHGFTEVDRQVEQVRAIGAEPSPAQRGDVEVVTVAQRPDLWDTAYEVLGAQAFEDMALIAPMHASIDEWRTSWIGDPAAMFLAVEGGEPVALAGLIADHDNPHRAENALTVVRRDWRGRGVAAYLKRIALAHAAATGITEVYTWTQRGNADMRRLNEHLGYATRLESFTMRRSV